QNPKTPKPQNPKTPGAGLSGDSKAQRCEISNKNRVRRMGAYLAQLSSVVDVSHNPCEGLKKSTVLYLPRFR
ncbi:MAG: hypothetical protein P4M11_12995, partial [Candidatus Pacebacteria bacterium]|nr:hypothetical protein [Candidatus Paceibacterota bacterium]